MLGHSYPAHADIIRVLAREVENAPGWNLVLSDRSAKGDMGGDQQCTRRLARACRGGEGVAEPALQEAIDKVVGRNEVIHEPRAWLRKEEGRRHVCIGRGRRERRPAAEVVLF